MRKINGNTRDSAAAYVKIFLKAYGIPEVEGNSHLIKHVIEPCFNNANIAKSMIRNVNYVTSNFLQPLKQQLMTGIIVQTPDILLSQLERILVELGVSDTIILAYIDLIRMHTNSNVQTNEYLQTQIIKLGRNSPVIYQYTNFILKLFKHDENQEETILERGQ